MSKVLDILDCQGVKVGEYTVPAEALEMEKGAQAVHDAVVAYRAGLRAGTACTKTRGEVRGGGAKPFRQKGRGAARAGSSRNPVWTGGGVAFGPRPRSFAKKMNKKVLLLAMKRAFAERIEEGSVVIVKDFVVADAKTKTAFSYLKNLKLAEDMVLFTIPKFEANQDFTAEEKAFFRATFNIANLGMGTSATLNTYELLRYGKLLFTEKSIDQFVKRLVAAN